MARLLAAREALDEPERANQVGLGYLAVDAGVLREQVDVVEDLGERRVGHGRERLAVVSCHHEVELVRGDARHGGSPAAESVAQPQALLVAGHRRLAARGRVRVAIGGHVQLCRHVIFQAVSLRLGSELARHEELPDEQQGHAASCFLLFVFFLFKQPARGPHERAQVPVELVHALRLHLAPREREPQAELQPVALRKSQRRQERHELRAARARVTRRRHRQRPVQRAELRVAARHEPVGSPAARRADHVQRRRAPRLAPEAHDAR